MPGRSLGHYEILEEIGHGGMGIVYKAHDKRLDRHVAIKILPADAVADPERKRRFVHEARAASALNHPNIVTIHDISSGELDGQPVDFIVMEFVEGRTLADCIGDAALALETAVEYAVQISSAMAAAHNAGIVHRDIKPANVIVARSGQLKIIDFGLTKLSEHLSDSGETATWATRPGTILGTVAYMSPEQAQGRSVDARSDVFSFGVMLYEMCTKRHPFRRDSDISINFAPRCTLPTLMLNGRYDFDTPLEGRSRPLFYRLGTRTEDKKLVIFESGHLPSDLNLVIREVLQWLDRYLGPVSGLQSTG